jgi:predicted aspartyl protease
MKKVGLFAPLIAVLILGACVTSPLDSPPLAAQKKHALAPGTLLLDDFLSSNGGYRKIALTKVKSGHLLMSASVNGVEGTFLLDTGANATVVHSTAKDKFKLKTEASAGKATGAGGVVDQERSKENTLQIADFVANGFTIRVMNLDHVHRALSLQGVEEIHGVIGADVMTLGSGVIDYGHLILYLKAP